MVDKKKKRKRTAKQYVPYKKPDYDLTTFTDEVVVLAFDADLHNL